MRRAAWVIGLGLLIGASPTIRAADPAWWSVSPPLIRSADPDHDNYRPANLGQLKNFADHARVHLNDRLAAVGGSGPAIESLVAAWPEGGAGNYAPINLGQLKAIADRFYARLDAVGFDYKSQLTANGYPAGRWTTMVGTSFQRPWAESTAPAANYAPANLGQLKVLFSFDLAGFTPGSGNPNQDTDNDGVPDTEEIVNLTDPNVPDSPLLNLQVSVILR